MSDAISENIAEHDCRYITDEKALILKEAIRRRDRAERYTQKVGYLTKFLALERKTDEDCERAFSTYVARATEPAKLLGCYTVRPSRSIGKCKERPFYIAVAVTAANEVVLLNADAVRLIDSLVGGFDALMSAGVQDAFAFFRQGRPVAILMPLIPKMVDIPADVAAVAREHAQRLKENQDVGSYEYRATKRGTA